MLHFNFCLHVSLQGCSSPIVVKFADTQKDKEQKRITQQLQQQMQQLNAASMWGNLTGLNSLGPQYLAVSTQDISCCDARRNRATVEDSLKHANCTA